ncbi:glycosyltransferase family 2 protein [Pseudomonas baetica]|uniref:glycosyltransferase family 2 protein n=1 Tax=Pseudomonas baetica TaxID=674054 RepID=UPI003EEF16D2
MMDASGIKVSVVIPTKNGGNRFRSVLNAVLEQQTEWSFEVIVIDSGSSDETLPIAQENSAVRIIKLEPADFQHGRTRNAAIQSAKGEYIAMITQDAQPVANTWLRTLVAEIEADEQIAGVFGRHVAYDDASIFTREELVQHFAGFESQSVAQLTDPERYRRDASYQQFLYFFSDNNALIRRSVWESYPYPEVDFSEDQAWARIIIEAGFKKAYSRDAAVYHSHNYGLWERFQRSFDESMALDDLFHYDQPKGFIVLLRNWLGLTLRDLQLLRQHLPTEGWKLILPAIKMPIDNFMRVSGGWLGTRGGFDCPALIAFCSRDKKLKRVKR